MLASFAKGVPEDAEKMFNRRRIVINVITVIVSFNTLVYALKAQSVSQSIKSSDPTHRTCTLTFSGGIPASTPKMQPVNGYSHKRCALQDGKA